MKFYEVEFLKNNQNYTKTIKAENLNTAQAKALSKNWKIIDIKEIQKSNFQRLKDENFILFFKELALLCEVGLSVQEAIRELYLMPFLQDYEKNIRQFNFSSKSKSSF